MHLKIHIFQSFNFNNKDSGARCWGENLPTPRVRESPQLTPLLHTVLNILQLKDLPLVYLYPFPFKGYTSPEADLLLLCNRGVY